jgi:diaminopimelate decarboxylase
VLVRDADGRAVLGGLVLSRLFEGPGAEGGPYDTPAYVYDLGAMKRAARALSAGFGDARHLVVYAVKACSAGPVLRALGSEGAGAEVVSGGELRLALASGIDPGSISMSGVAKTDAELDLAIGAGPRGILALQAESVEELPRIAARARALGRRARVSLRVNPGVVADTHPQVATGHDEAKFGIALPDLGRALEVLGAEPSLALTGVGCHIGSQLTTTHEALAGARVLLEVARRVEGSLGARLELLDFGGGFGIDYGDGCGAAPADFAAGFASLVRGTELADRLLVVEPGRSLVGPACVLCATVVSTKRSVGTPGPDLVPVPRRWMLLDAGMNDLVRPAMYGARHRVEPLDDAGAPRERFRVVGPVCESSDDFGEHELPGDAGRVLFRDAGAYGFSMASNYNARPLPTELFVEDGRVVAVKRAEPIERWVERRL